MGRCRGFLPPPVCEQCGQSPTLGETLWPGDQWLCISCRSESIPGKDTLSKSMLKMIEHRQERNLACTLEAQGDPAPTEHHRAEWARQLATNLHRRGTARSKELAQAKGEVIPPETDQSLHDTLAVPDLASVEASFERSRLLLSSGPNVAAMGLDAADTIQAQNSLEKMLAHQLAATHAVIMEQVGQVHSREEGQASAKRLTAIARCLTAYQQGVLTVKKLRQTGNQRIVVQYVNVSEGGQAVIGTVERSSGQ
jgi:aminoglycoside phosphotransferase family enzyme